MSSRFRQLIAAAAAAVALAAPAAAQQPRTGIVGDMMRDVADVQKKFDALAGAIPADKYDWRPGAGVRSVREVLLHVAGENEYLPSATGVKPSAESGISGTDYATVTAFEKQSLTPAATTAALDRSFAHVLAAMRDTPDARLDDHVKFFGQDFTVRQLWLATTTHLHEHLGQAIAYARMNGVTPPWSR